MRGSSAFHVLAACDIRGVGVVAGGQARRADVHEVVVPSGGFWRRASGGSHLAAGRHASCPHGPAEDYALPADQQAQGCGCGPGTAARVRWRARGTGSSGCRRRDAGSEPCYRGGAGWVRDLVRREQREMLRVAPPWDRGGAGRLNRTGVAGEVAATGRGAGDARAPARTSGLLVILAVPGAAEGVG
jgi:hypothetical protein